MCALSSATACAVSLVLCDTGDRTGSLETYEGLGFYLNLLETLELGCGSGRHQACVRETRPPSFLAGARCPGD